MKTFIVFFFITPRYTMTKSTSIVFILGFALFFKLEKKSWSLVMIVLMIAVGLFLFTYESTQFDVGGFLLILTASFMSGLRWTLAQLLMQKSKMGLENPIDMVYHVQPWMVIAILPFAVAFEGTVLGLLYSKRIKTVSWHNIQSPAVNSSLRKGPRVFTTCKTYCFENLSHTSVRALTVCAGALLAFAMEVSEYLVVTRTSSLTLSVACIFKEVFTLVLAVEWTGDKISVVNLIGLLVCLGGIIVHVVQKLTRTNKDGRGDGTKTNFEMKTPLIADAHSSGDETDDDSSNVLFSILQQRDATR
uniref:Sugar phosphate transporter domain-containing protein n=1 Tax=Timema poppense TaxID=170557 RepID=A0A7R9D9V0_TIMPO|nr:unnamed protein product [Timema poppensis]